MRRLFLACLLAGWIPLCAVDLPENDKQLSHQNYQMQPTGNYIFYMRLDDLAEVKAAQGNVEFVVEALADGFEVRLRSNGNGMKATCKGAKMYFHNVSHDDFVEWDGTGGKMTLTWKPK